MWCEILKSDTFWVSAALSCLWNIAFGIGINVAMHWDGAKIAFLTHQPNDMASAFAYQAFFCGLFTTPFSSGFISQRVAAGAITPPNADAIEKSWLKCILCSGSCVRSLLLALGSLLFFGFPTIGLGTRVCTDQSECQLRVWVFLAILVVWSIPLQIAVSLLNYASTAHRSRDTHCSLNVALLKGAADTTHQASEGGVERAVALLKGAAETIHQACEGGVGRAVELLKGAAETIRQACEGGVGRAVELLKGATETIRQACEGGVGRARELLKGAADTTHQASEGGVGRAVELLKGATETIRQGCEGGVGRAMELLKGATETIRQASEGGVGRAVELLKGAAETIRQASEGGVGRAVELLKGTADTIHQASEGGQGRAVELLKAAAETIRQGCEAGVGRARELLKGAAETICQASEGGVGRADFDSSRLQKVAVVEAVPPEEAAQLAEDGCSPLPQLVVIPGNVKILEQRREENPGHRHLQKGSSGDDDGKKDVSKLPFEECEQVYQQARARFFYDKSDKANGAAEISNGVAPQNAKTDQPKKHEMRLAQDRMNDMKDPAYNRNVVCNMPNPNSGYAGKAPFSAAPLYPSNDPQVKALEAAKAGVAARRAQAVLPQSGIYNPPVPPGSLRAPAMTQANNPPVPPGSLRAPMTPQKFQQAQLQRSTSTGQFQQAQQMQTQQGQQMMYSQQRPPWPVGLPQGVGPQKQELKFASMLTHSNSNRVLGA